MERLLNQMKTKFVDQQIPVVLGEFGANWRNISGQTGESQEKHDASIRWHYYMLTKLALEKGMVPMMWDTNYCNRPSMTIIDRKNLKIYNDLMMDGINQAASEVADDLPAIATNQESPAVIFDLQGHRLDDKQRLQGFCIINGKVCQIR